MKILVTGGSGFIGRNLVDLLGNRYEVLAPSHADLDLADDMAVRDYLQVNPVDVIIHAAGKPGHRNTKDPTGIFYYNSRMFFNLMRNRDRFGKMIIAGSGAVYDMRHYRPKMKEEYFDTHVPADEHGFFRYVTARCTAREEGIVDLRLFGVFGRYEDYAIRFISNAICKTLFGLPITLRQNRRFDYLYIKDLFPVINHFIENDAIYPEYNVTPDQSVELLTLAQIVRSVSGKDLPIIVAQEGMGLEYSGDNSRLRKEMPGLRFTGFDVTIKELYEWYREHRSLINRDFLLVDK